MWPGPKFNICATLPHTSQLLPGTKGQSWDLSSGFLTSFSLLFLLQHTSLPTPSRLCVDAGSSQDHRSSGQSLSQGWPESTFQEASRANISYRPNRDTLSAEWSVVNNKAGTRGINQECPRYMFVSVTNLISEKSGVTLRLALVAKILGSSTTGSPTNHCLCVVWALACSADRFLTLQCPQELLWRSKKTNSHNKPQSFWSTAGFIWWHDQRAKGRQYMPSWQHWFD